MGLEDLETDFIFMMVDSGLGNLMADSVAISR